MLLGLAVLLVVLWALGFLAFHVTAAVIHFLIIAAIVVFVLHLVSGRNRTGY